MRLVRRVPFTLILSIVLVVVAIISDPFRGTGPRLSEIAGLDLETLTDRQWWSLFTSAFFVDNTGQLLIVVLATLLGVGVSEWLMGWRRATIAFIVTGVLAFSIGLAAQAAGVFAGEFWARSVRSLDTVDPLTPILGTLATASAFAPVLWRRRIRIVMVATLAVFLLYAGSPSDLYRLVAVALGLALGALLSRRRIRFARWTSSHHETRVLLAAVAAAFALGPLITIISNRRLGLLSPLGIFVANGSPRARSCAIPAGLTACADQLAAHGGRGVGALVLAVVPLLLILIGAYGLSIGRRTAVFVVAGVAAADGLLAVVYFGIVPALGPATRSSTRIAEAPEFVVWIVANALLPIIFAVVLFSQRRHFTITTPKRVLRHFAIVLAVGIAAACALYVGIGLLLRTQFRPVVGLTDLLADLPQRFTPVAFLATQSRPFIPETLSARVLYHGIGPLLWLFVLVCVVLLLRDRRTALSTLGDAAHFRTLLAQSGDSMAFPGTWHGNRYWFNRERSTAIAFRIANGCAVTTSGPVGTSLDASDTVAQFIRFCDANAWMPVFYSISSDWAHVLAELGWSTTVIAEETVIDVPAWSTTGKKWQDVRSSVNRAARDGVRVTWGTWSTLSARTTRQIAEISEQWVVEKKLPELGFTLGGLDELRDDDVLLGVAAGEDGSVHAVTSWLPCRRDGKLIGWTLDFMRRSSDGMNGVMEFMIAEAAVRAQLDGLGFLSLSGAPLAIAESNEKPTPLDRVLATLGRSLEPVYGFRSLLAFKQKFQPRLVPLHIAYPDAMALPAIAIALSRCYLPDLTLRETATLMRTLR